MTDLFEPNGGQPADDSPRAKAEKAFRELTSRSHAAALRAAGRNASADGLRQIALEILREAEAREARR